MEKRFIIVFCIIIIIITMFIVEIAKYIKNGNELNNLNNMNKDITILEDAISMYYLNSGNLPIKSEIEFNHSINPNDDLTYYEIDLFALNNVELTYGNNKEEGDIYIINSNSHTIYYLKGIEYKEKHYYTKSVEYDYIDLANYK